MDNKKYLDCECGGEILKVQYEEDSHTNSDGSITITPSYYLSIFKYRGFGKIPLKTRIKFAWNMLCKGTWYGDEIILTPDEMEKLYYFIETNNNKKIEVTAEPIVL